MGKYDGASASRNGYVSNGENHPTVPKKIYNESMAEGIRKIIGKAKDNVVNPTMIMPSKELKQIRELEDEEKRK